VFSRENVAMSNEDPIAFMFTWSTYGTWLPGDERGWVEYRRGLRLPDPIRELEAAAKMSETACRLNREQREQVHLQVVETCAHKGWELYAVNCRSNHLHAVISASAMPKMMREQLKAWCSRRLNDFQRAQSLEVRENWWAQRGSIRWIYDPNGLEAAVLYVRDGQDDPRRFQG
jgi:REP element-mobilizing transposase RayT